MKNKTLSAVLALFILIPIWGVIKERGIGYYTAPYYTQTVYKHLEDTFNRSQYRQKNPTALIPDETVFSYAAGAYLAGVDPILVNSEHTPLGKYFLAASIFLFKNDRGIVVLFGFLTLFALWMVSRRALGKTYIALLPVAVFSWEPLFLDQLRYVPLLDIVQLPFIFFTIAVFLSEIYTRRYIKTALFLGLVMATKTVVPGILLTCVFILFFLFRRRFSDILRLMLWLPLTVIVFCLSYIRTFLSGYSLSDFVGFQKWIFLYQKSKILFPFSVWRLIFLNQWQAWWGDFSLLKAADWRITWPIGVLAALLLTLITLVRKTHLTPNSQVLLLWFILYGAFLSIGVVSSRFLLPFLPVTYILGVVLLKKIL